MEEKTDQQIISEYMRSLALKSHKQSPRSREFYQMMGRLGGKRGKGVKKPRTK